MTELTELSDVIKKLIQEGKDPNDLQSEFENVMGDTYGWESYVEIFWRKMTVCSKCGSSYAGVCSDDPSIDMLDSKNPSFHKNQPGVTIIPFSEFYRSR